MNHFVKARTCFYNFLLFMCKIFPENQVIHGFLALRAMQLAMLDMSWSACGNFLRNNLDYQVLVGYSSAKSFVVELTPPQTPIFRDLGRKIVRNMRLAIYYNYIYIYIYFLNSGDSMYNSLFSICNNSKHICSHFIEHIDERERERLFGALLKSKETRQGCLCKDQRAFFFLFLFLKKTWRRRQWVWIFFFFGEVRQLGWPLTSWLQNLLSHDITFFSYVNFVEFVVWKEKKKKKNCGIIRRRYFLLPYEFGRYSSILFYILQNPQWVALWQWPPLLVIEM